ncbi:MULTISPECIES: DUF397 domain-containing protein [unclassified Streptomyces]|uniref:DUF397 domain-containing protein n=1 Tax=unclassified Streptomyces TaxID=2593676 RepID=UPI002E348F1F|nr:MULTISPECIES: DUF397 domain-containing protein [unclassified Streptomyces]
MSTSELTWFKSTYSSGGSGDCLEVAATARTIHVRDSKNPQGPCLTLSSVTWSEFVTYAVTRT